MNHEEVSDQIIERICDCGWKAYLTGGAVRDSFINIEPLDYDIVTDAPPEELMRIFPDRKVKMGIGTNFLVTLIDGIDVATYRSDRNTGPGRFNCEATACETLEEDLARRDFTVNAFAVCPYTGDVVDPYNGRKDLNEKIIRFVGDPNERIYEDELRMIRAARFVCLLEGELHPRTFNAIKEKRDLVKNISPERIATELVKVMKYKKPSIFFNVLHETGILEIIFPEVERLYGHPGGMHHNETLDTHSLIVGDSLSPKDPILRLIGYFHDIGKPLAWDFNNDGTFVNHENLGAHMIEKLFKRFKFPNDETERAKSLVALHMRSLPDLKTGKAIRRALNKFAEFHISWKEWMLLKIADQKGNLGKPNYTRDQIKKVVLKIHKAKSEVKKADYTKSILDLNGHDIMKAFDIPQGVHIGHILNNLFQVVLDDPSLNEKDTLLKIAKENDLWVHSLTDSLEKNSSRRLRS